MQRPILFCAFFALAAPVLAQDAPTPSEELGRLQRFVGNWVGEGQARSPGAAEMEDWTGQAKIGWILDNFYLQSDIQVDVGMPTPMQLRSVFGIDSERDQLVVFSVSNVGGGEFNDASWVGDDTLVSMQSGILDGDPFISRSTWRFGDDGSYTYTAQRAIADGPFETIVEGKFTKAAAARPQAVEAAFRNQPPSAPMQSIARCYGSYQLVGSMTPAPGAPSMSITGTEVMRPAFGGQVMHSKVVGSAEGFEEGSYKAESYTCWSADRNCYLQVAFDNMGMIGEAEMRWAGDDELIVTVSGLQFGQPFLSRTKIKLGNAGVAGVESLAIVGAGEPAQVFEATYSPKKN